ncbi:peptidase inhibitor family I36 protein [Rathayibacter agropyri]|uniref:peptidase inhibitor family I36 protein n=1 Tax=Rathayibacter agropyri TaxID=1634927 RepID=UPI0015655367|nr:peptidase inhibitor family I36 protein [Rathayibacter agropyri]NRD08674.1 peptidase inhibitor family I36 protein [Rathayibacter agropyri]
MSHITRSTFPRRLILAAGSAAIATVSVLACGVAPASASQTMDCPNGQYCAWEDDRQQGHIFNNVVTMANIGESWNDRFSSLQNLRGVTVGFYENDYGRGAARLVRDGEVASELQWEWHDGRTWNDSITSIVVF